MASIGILALTAVTAAATASVFARPRIRKLNLRQKANTTLDIYDIAKPIQYKSDTGNSSDCILFITGFRDVPIVFSEIVNTYFSNEKFDYYIPRNIGTGRTFLQENITFKDWLLFYQDTLEILLTRYETIHIITKDIGYAIALYLYKNYSSRIGNIVLINPEEDTDIPKTLTIRTSVLKRNNSNMSNPYFEPIVTKSQVQEAIKLLNITSKSKITFPDDNKCYIVSNNPNKTLKKLINNVNLENSLENALFQSFNVLPKILKIPSSIKDPQTSDPTIFTIDLTNMQSFKSYNNLKNSIQLYWNSKLFECLSIINGQIHRVLKEDSIDGRFKSVTFLEKPQSISQSILDAFYGDGELVKNVDFSDSSWEIIEENIDPINEQNFLNKIPTRDIDGMIFYSKFRNAYAIRDNNTNKYHILVTANNTIDVNLDQNIYCLQTGLDENSPDWVIDEYIPDVIVTSQNKDTTSDIENNNALVKVHDYLCWHWNDGYGVGKSFLNYGTNTPLLLLARDYVPLGEVFQYSGREHFHIMYDFVADLFLVLYGRKFNGNQDTFWKEPTWRILRMAGDNGGYRHVQLKDMIAVGEEKVNDSFTKQIWNRFFINVSKPKHEDVALFANKDDIYTNQKAGALYCADINTRTSMYFEKLYFRARHYLGGDDTDIVYKERFFLKEQLISCFYGDDIGVGKYINLIPSSPKVPSRYGMYVGSLFKNISIRDAADLVSAYVKSTTRTNSGSETKTEKLASTMYKYNLGNAKNKEFKALSTFHKRPVGYVCETNNLVVTDSQLKDYIINYLFKKEISDKLSFNAQSVTSGTTMNDSIAKIKYDNANNLNYNIFKDIRSCWNLDQVMKRDFNFYAIDWKEENNPDILKLYSKLWV